MFRLLQKFILTTFFAVYASQASAMFIQPDWLDPTQPGVGTNRYAYSFNDPINKSDPGGNCAAGCVGDVFGAIIGIGLVAAEYASDALNDGKINGNGLIGGGIQGVAGLVGDIAQGIFSQDTVHSESNDSDGDNGNEEDGDNDPNGTPPDPVDILSGIPGTKKCGSCKEWAEEAKSRLDQAQIKSKVVTVKSPTDFIQTDDGTVITTNGTHQGVQVGDTVFDNMNPMGMPTQGWLDNMGFGEGFGVGPGGWSISFD